MPCRRCQKNGLPSPRGRRATESRSTYRARSPDASRGRRERGARGSQRVRHPATVEFTADPVKTGRPSRERRQVLRSCGRARSHLPRAWRPDGFPVRGSADPGATAISALPSAAPRKRVAHQSHAGAGCRGGDHTRGRPARGDRQAVGCLRHTGPARQWRPASRTAAGEDPRRPFCHVIQTYQYIPPMPPPGMAGADFSSSFFSTTTHSVVSSSEAMEAAFCRAVRVTLVGSITPASTRSSY